jgi:hypothetical protein
MRIAILLALLLSPALVSAQTLVHYWNFNSSAFLQPTTGAGTLSTTLGSSSELTTGTGQDFSARNARDGDVAGAHVRMNNPIGATLTFHLPTTGFENPIVRYETRRSGSGANTQYVSYSVNGVDYTALDTIAPPDGAPTLVELDFSGIAGADNNADFRIRITIAQVDNGTGGAAGNNRFDNVTLDATAQAGANQPPVYVGSLGFRELAVGVEPLFVDPIPLFEDADGDPLTFTFTSSDPDVAACVFMMREGSEHICGLTPNRAGGATISVSATDGKSDPVTASFRILALPAAHPVKSSDFTFSEWADSEPAGRFPSNMIFLQSGKNDPGLADPLTFPYQIPLADASDPADAAFPYKAIARTRINGLGADGISFINTGRGRDLGGALVAADLTDVTAATIGFKASTLTVNFRTYHLRLRYRVGVDGPWMDVGGATPVEYQRDTVADVEQAFSDIPVPADALGQPYVQFLWQYHFTGTQLEGGGARDRIRLDDITITDLTGASTPGEGRTTPDTFELLGAYPNPFNPSTVLRFRTTGAHGGTPLRLSVYDLLGREVAVLVDGMMPAGAHRAVFDASGLASGVYVVRLEAGGEWRTSRITLLK